MRHRRTGGSRTVSMRASSLRSTPFCTTANWKKRKKLVHDYYNVEVDEFIVIVQDMGLLELDFCTNRATSLPVRHPHAGESQVLAEVHQIVLARELNLKEISASVPPCLKTPSLNTLSTARCASPIPASVTSATPTTGRSANRTTALKPAITLHAGTYKRARGGLRQASAVGEGQQPRRRDLRALVAAGVRSFKIEGPQGVCEKYHRSLSPAVR